MQMMLISVWFALFSTAADWKPYRTGEVRLSLPPNWKTEIHSPSPSAVSLLLTSECPPKRALVMLIAAAEKHPLNPDSARKYTQDIRNQAVSFQMGTHNRDTVGGQPALKFSYTAQFPRITLSYVTFMISVDSKTYFLTLSTPTSNLSDFESKFEKIASLISFSEH